MFKNRHVYTCPDVIHMRNRARKINRTTALVTVVSLVALNVWGWHESKKIDAKLENETDTSTE